MSVTVTVNGVPLKVYVDEEIKKEIQTHRQSEVAPCREQLRRISARGRFLITADRVVVVVEF